MADKADRRRQQDALAKEQHRHEAAHALQEAAAARARQEVARLSNVIARARQEDSRCQQLLAEQAALARQEAAAAAVKSYFQQSNTSQTYYRCYFSIVARR